MSETVMYWNRVPGKFVNKQTGVPFSLSPSLSIGLQFTGTVREWYETLNETIIDVRNHLHRDMGRNSDEINVTVSPDVRCILESTIIFKPGLDKKGDRRDPVGTLCGMNVFESKACPRFEVEIEFRSGSSIKRGRVIIKDD